MQKTLIAALLCLVLAVWAVLPAAAQVSVLSGSEPESATIDAADLTPEAIDALVSRLTDEEVRTLLLDQLNANAVEAAPETTASFGEFFHHATIGAFGVIVYGITNLPSALAFQTRAFEDFHQTFGSSGWGGLFGIVLAAIAIGLAAEWVIRRFFLRILPKLDVVPDPTLRQSVIFLVRRLVREVLGVVVFYIFAVIALNNLLEADLLPMGDTMLYGLILLPRLIYTLSRFVLAPNFADYRLVHTDDWTARFLSRHLVGLAVVSGLLSIFVAFNLRIERQEGEIGLGFLFDLALRIYLAWIIWRAWDGLVSMMRGPGDEVTALEERVARAYPVFAITVVFAMWWLVSTILSYGAIELITGGAHRLTMVLLLLAPAFDTVIRALVHHLTPAMKGEGEVARIAYSATKSAYKRIGRVIVFGLVLFLIAGAWNLSPEMLANAGAAGTVVEAVFEVSFVLILGYLAWEVATLLINRRLAAEFSAAGGDPNAEGAGEIGGAGASRLSTVLPLFRLVLQTSIVVVFGLIALSELGIDTTPLLAGAGIAGLAIGFGAQKLVSDVVSGAFFLIDDAFRKGEYVETGSAKGTVEKISIRSMQLRHHNGPVFTLPYGEIASLKNYSRDWGIMKLPFIFPFDADPERIRKIFKKIGVELLDHPEYGEYFLQPFKSQGVLSIDDVGMTIRGKFMVKPGKQFEIRKEIFTRVRTALDEAGIPFARREVRVALPEAAAGDEALAEQAAKAAGAAAAIQEKSQAN